MEKPAPNQRRRMILRLGLIGGAAFVLGKVLGPTLDFFGGSVSLNGNQEHDFTNFRVVETNKELGFYDKLGNEILIIDKDQ